jgi:hypothetical protein
MQLSLRGENLGVAPFYYPWSVEWALFDPSGKLVKLENTKWDIRTWPIASATTNNWISFVASRCKLIIAPFTLRKKITCQ